MVHMCANKNRVNVNTHVSRVSFEVARMAYIAFLVSSRITVIVSANKRRDEVLKIVVFMRETFTRPIKVELNDRVNDYLYP